MKNLLLALLFAPLSLIGENTKTLKSTIESVTVYQQGAQIHRNAYYSIGKGLTVISIDNISQQIDPKSIQVTGTGDMIILDSKYKFKYPKPLPIGTVIPTPQLDMELIYLGDSIIDIDYQLTGFQHRLDVLQTQKHILSNNGAIKGVGKVNDSIPLLKEALTYYYEKMNAIHSEVLELTIQKNKVLKTKNRINYRISIINDFKNNAQKKENTYQNPISSIEITLSANSSISGKLEVSYLVSSAGWAPLYDIRSNSLKNNIDLTYKAQVFQNTGIDWTDARLTLSTTNPYSNKTKPTLSPYYVYYNQHNRNQSNYELQKETLEEERDELAADRPSAPIKASTYSSAKKAKESTYAYNYVQLNEQLISVEYQINLPYSISSNNEKHLVLVRQESLKSDYKYYTIPKIDPSAYLVAELSNLDDLNLIPGIANIFHDGTYIGETTINPSIMADSLALSLGKDQNIQVKRTLLKKDSKTKIIGDKTVKTYAYLIDIKNHKSSNLDIILQDQIPVTQNSEISITVEELSKGKLNEVTGIIDWHLKLKAKETRTIKLIYTVSTAKNKATNLAQH